MPKGRGSDGDLQRVGHPFGPIVLAVFVRYRVMVLDGDHAGHVIGIVVADYRNADAWAAWMMPT